MECHGGSYYVFASAFRYSLKENAAFESSSSISSSFADYLLFIIAHGNEGAMPHVPGISPFEECHLVDQLRFDPTALLHFPCG
jgi:hypothetical protein